MGARTVTVDVLDAETGALVSTHGRLSRRDADELVAWFGDDAVSHAWGVRPCRVLVREGG